MSMYEDRWKLVEADLKQFKLDSRDAYSNMAHEVTIIKGLAYNSIERLRDLSTQVGDLGKRFSMLEYRIDYVETRINRGFGEMDQRFTAIQTHMDQRFEQVDQRFEAMQTHMDQRFEQVDQRFEQVDRRFEQVDRRFEQVDQRFAQMDQRFDSLEGMLNKILARLPE